MPPFTVQQIDHLVLRVADLPRAVAFYVQVLGCPVVRRRDDLGLVHLRAGSALVDLVSLDGPLGRAGGAAAGADGRNVDHLCLRIDPFDEAALRTHLRTHGVPHGEDTPTNFGAEGTGPSIYLQDPDGNTVELKGPAQRAMPQPADEQRGAYTLSSRRERMDAAAVHAYLTRSYWSTGIPRAAVERAMAHSLCFGIFHGAEQVAFSRVLTDHTTYGYLADVYVLEPHRGQGLSKWMMEGVLAHPALQGLRKFMLSTRDAHGLYRRFGFEPAAKPGNVMERVRPNPYGGG